MAEALSVACGVTVERVGEKGGSEGERSGVRRQTPWQQSHFHPSHRWGKLRPGFSSREWEREGSSGRLPDAHPEAF